MDPDETYERLRRLAMTIADEEHETPEAREAAEAFLSLDGWLRSSGFLPEAWRTRA
jgi:hypothetical protein